MVSRSGCRIGISADLARLDPLPLRTELDRAGGKGSEAELGWILAGLPLALLVGILLARATGVPALTGLAAATLAHAVTAGTLLVRLWPILR